MRQIEDLVTASVIVILVVLNFVLIYKLDTLEDKLKQKEYQIKIRETRANQKVREAEQVIKDNTIYLEDIN
jgi:uncharacterized membrane protein